MQVLVAVLGTRMGLSWTRWFDGTMVRLGELLTLWERLRQPPRVLGVRVGALGTMPYRGIPLLVTVAGAGVLRVGRSIQLVTDGGVWCVAAPAGRPVEVRFRNLVGRAVQSFDVPAAVLAEAPARPRVPAVRRVGALRFPVGAPALRAVRSATSGAVAASPSARAAVPTLPPVHVVQDDGAWVVHTRGSPEIYLVSNDDETLRRVAVRVATTSPRAAS